MLRFQRVCRGARRFELRFASQAPQKLSAEEQALREEKLAVSNFYNAIVHNGRQVCNEFIFCCNFA